MSHRRRAAGTRRTTSGLLLLVVGVLIAVGAPVAWAASHQDPALRPIDQGVAVQLAQASVANSVLSTAPVPASALAPGRPPTAQAEASSTSTPVLRVSAGRARESSSVPTTRTPAAVTARRSAVRSAPEPVIVAKPAAGFGIPARLRIPAIGIDAPVDAVGVDDKGELAVPEQVERIGWYRFGPRPGSSAGSVVLSGHVDSAAQGLGAFSGLGGLKSGDAVVVSDAAGRSLRYQVVGREAFDKKTVPLAELFSRTGSARLTLITCGGDFDSSIHSYVDNIVVTAVPG